MEINKRTPSCERKVKIISLNLGENALPLTKSKTTLTYSLYMVHSSREANWKQ